MSWCHQTKERQWLGLYPGLLHHQSASQCCHGHHGKSCKAENWNVCLLFLPDDLEALGFQKATAKCRIVSCCCCLGFLHIQCEICQNKLTTMDQDTKSFFLISFLIRQNTAFFFFFFYLFINFFANCYFQLTNILHTNNEKSSTMKRQAVWIFSLFLHKILPSSLIAYSNIHDIFLSSVLPTSNIYMHVKDVNCPQMSQLQYQHPHLAGTWQPLAHILHKSVDSILTKLF